MSGMHKPNSSGGSWERELKDGWAAYWQALDLLGHDDHPTALRLLAEAETIFRTGDEQDGLWRTLSGQAAIHWYTGDTALAVARATAALRSALSVGGGIGLGVAAWQLAMLNLSQGEYLKASEGFAHAVDAFGLDHRSTPGSLMITCAQLCQEIDRWQQLYAQRHVARRTASEVVEAIKRDLVARLAQVADALRSTWLQRDPSEAVEQLLLLPPSGRPPGLPAPGIRRSSFSQRLARWWHRLVEHNMSVGAIPSVGPPREYTILPTPVLTPTSIATSEPTPLVPTEDQLQEESAAVPSKDAQLVIYCFGAFRVSLDTIPIERWDSMRGRTIFKYLVIRRGMPTSKELLADMFWPGSEPELARRSLHQAIYCLRQSLKRVASDLPIIQFNDDCYQINPQISIWVDGEEFSAAISQARAHMAGGRSEEAMRAYAVASDLASGDFLEEDRYEPWAEELRQSYRGMCTEALQRLTRHHYEQGAYATAILVAQRALAQDSCDEEAHQMLMRCYIAQGLRHLAVRQYQICHNALKTDLGLAPSNEIEQLYSSIVAES